MKLTPHPQLPILDRLAFILPLRFRRSDDFEEKMEIIKNKAEKLIEQGYCEPAFLSSRRYLTNLRIPLEGGSSALVQIGAVNPATQKGGVRIDINPAKFEAGDVEQLHRRMRKIIGSDYDFLLKSPLLNVIHVAVDIQNVCLRDLVIDYTNAQRMTMFGKRMDTKGHVEGYNFGSVSSSYQTAAYDKKRERVNAAILDIAHSGNAGTTADPLKDNKISQLKVSRGLPQTMRVEVRGKKLNGIAPWKLAEQPNRFARFKFCAFDNANAKLPPWLQESVLSLCKQNGVKATLERFKNTEHARKVNAFLQQSKVDWWNPEDLWAQACQQLEDSEIFPPEAFKRSAQPKKCSTPPRRRISDS